MSIHFHNSGLKYRILKNLYKIGSAAFAVNVNTTHKQHRLHRNRLSRILKTDILVENSTSKMLQNKFVFIYCYSTFDFKNDKLVISTAFHFNLEITKHFLPPNKVIIKQIACEKSNIVSLESVRHYIVWARQTDFLTVILQGSTSLFKLVL